MKTAVTIALLVDGDSVPFWLAESIKRLRDSDYAEFPIILKQRAPDSSATKQRSRGTGICPFSSATPDGAQYALFRRYQQFDARLKRRQPAYDSAIALSQLLPDARLVDCEAGDAPEAVQQKIQNPAIDVLLNTGLQATDAVPNLITEAGIWSFGNGNGVPFSDQPCGFYELTTGAPVTAIGLQMQLANGEIKNTYQLSESRHLPDILLLGRQRQNVMMQAVTQLDSAIKRLHEEGTNKFIEWAKTQSRTVTTETPAQPYPRNLAMLLRMIAHALRYTILKIRKWVFYEQWTLLHHDAIENSDPTQVELSRFQEITPPDDRIWADPFVVADDNDPDKFHIFMEEMEYGSSHGHIAVLTIDRQGKHNGSVPVIQHPYHMSYPFIFEYDGQRYMIPETGDNHTIQLYRCVNFPYQWEFVKNLMDNVLAVDTNVIEVDGKWWMFTTLRESKHTNCLDQLHLFYADSPLSGQWQPHALNPVSRDVRTARQAGDLFRHEGKLFRTSQDGGYHYGWGMKINEIVQLNEKEYVERVVSTIEPRWRWSVIATHSHSRIGDVAVSDARVLRPRFLRWLRRRLG